MGILKNLPVILAAVSAFITGLYGYLSGQPSSRVYRNMCLFLVAFYIIGTLMKHTFERIREEMAEKAASEEAATAAADALALAAADSPTAAVSPTAAQSEPGPDAAPALEEGQAPGGGDGDTVDGGGEYGEYGDYEGGGYGEPGDSDDSDDSGEYDEYADDVDE